MSWGSVQMRRLGDGARWRCRWRIATAPVRGVDGAQSVVGARRPEGKGAVRIAGRRVMQEVVSKFRARLDIVAALGFRHGRRKLVHTFLAVEDDISLGAYLEHPE